MRMCNLLMRHLWLFVLAQFLGVDALLSQPPRLNAFNREQTSPVSRF